MFESGVGLRGGGSRRRGPEVTCGPADVAMLAQVVEAGRVENRAAARKVLAAGALWDAWIERDVELGSGMIADCGNAAIAELSVRLGCSKTVAQSFAEIGIDLRLRLPRTRAAFEAGDLDLARVRAICRETTGLSPGAVADLEEGIVGAARQFSPGPLGAEIERLVLLHCPQEAAEQRRTVQAWQRGVVNRRGRGCSTVEVTVSPEEGQAVMQLVAEFTRTVCAQDPRGVREKMVDAVLALMHGEPYLACMCEREDCVAEKAGALPGRRAPLTQITIDVATLLGLVSSPAYLHGHGPIDPELARELASDGTWQAMLTELLEVAEELGLLDRDATDSDNDGEDADNADAVSADADGADEGGAGTGGMGGEAAADTGTRGDRADTTGAHVNTVGVRRGGGDRSGTSLSDHAGPPPGGETDTEAAEDDSTGSNATSTGREGAAAKDPDPAGRTGHTVGEPPGAARREAEDAVRGAAHAHAVDADDDCPHHDDAPDDGANAVDCATRAAAPSNSGVIDSKAEATESTGDNIGRERGSDAGGTHIGRNDGATSARASDGGDDETDSTDDESPPDIPAPDTPAGSPPDPSTSDTPAPKLRFAVRSFLARAGRRSAGAIPAPDPTQAHTNTPQSPPTSVGTIAEAILAAVRANPALACGVYRDDHGGLLVPPPGALTYRPDAATAALVRARDRHCRFPGCHRPAAQCQLDHIAEYLVRNPLTGGWTIVSNLQCLCSFHHQLKTLGFWRVVPLGDPHHTGHALLWTSVFGTTAVTLPGGATAVADLATPRPRVTGRRRGVIGDPTSQEEQSDDPPPF